jgi:hypothetical protein
VAINSNSQTFNTNLLAAHKRTEVPFWDVTGNASNHIEHTCNIQCAEEVLSYKTAAISVGSHPLCAILHHFGTNCRRLIFVTTPVPA